MFKLKVNFYFEYAIELLVTSSSDLAPKQTNNSLKNSWVLNSLKSFNIEYKSQTCNTQWTLWAVFTHAISDFTIIPYHVNIIHWMKNITIIILQLYPYLYICVYLARAAGGSNKLIYNRFSLITLML